MAKRPMAEANRISAMLRAVLQAERFPVDVKQLALEYSAKCFPNDPITDIRPIALPSFEGVLRQHKSKSKWMIAYNDQMQSEGRIRFTLAHEFGHYILHRQSQSQFHCSQEDIYDWDSTEHQLESEADIFASFLLMPLDDYRKQIENQTISIELLKHCANRYGVSLMAAALKWLEISPARAVVVAARDGYILWARSNKAAYRSGVYLPSRKRTIAVPAGSLVSSTKYVAGGESALQRAQLWFPAESENMPLSELVFVSEGYYAFTLGILLMPDAERYFNVQDDELLSELDGNLNKKGR